MGQSEKNKLVDDLTQRLKKETEAKEKLEGQLAETEKECTRTRFAFVQRIADNEELLKYLKEQNDSLLAKSRTLAGVDINTGDDDAVLLSEYRVVE